MGSLESTGSESLSGGAVSVRAACALQGEFECERPHTSRGSPAAAGWARRSASRRSARCRT
eukprot:2104387-Prymnesium_polylepis.1